MPMSERSVGLFGGSFDPVHRGHLSIAQSFLNASHILELWVMLTPESPHKQSEDKTDYNLRFKMLQLAFADTKNVEVSDFEQQLSPPYYTVKTLRKLKKTFKNKHFFLCMGEDSLIDFDSWHQWEDILEYCELLVARRPSYEVRELDTKILQHTHFVSHEPMDISSTEIRKKVRQDENIANLVPTEVEEFIRNNQLYK
jgi:nicotinate-nucleotide adenylyltransferase